ncbi:hypothetical protein OG824_13445 [Streptomyces prunicolor]|uniref:hypothetical protein n=1 Tax=Streptomyces prunicolor TaxID=67348 RepID=UPI00225415A8|nr:hypothetical protein [Streptomyces prunicolor]MCX5236207.1 hypothetical protein [Streptomyces prunicolor]
MSRSDSGWEYGEWGARWAPTTSAVLAEITVDKYGEEYVESMGELNNLIRAVQRDASETLREAGHEEAARLIFPNYPEENEQ